MILHVLSMGSPSLVFLAFRPLFSTVVFDCKATTNLRPRLTAPHNLLTLVRVMAFDMSSLAAKIPLDIEPGSIEDLLTNVYLGQTATTKLTLLWGPAQRAALRVVGLSDLRIEEVVPMGSDDDNRQPYNRYLSNGYDIDTADTLQGFFTLDEENPFWVFYDRVLAALESCDGLAVALGAQPRIATEFVVMSFVDSVWSTSSDVWPAGPRAWFVAFIPSVLVR